ncbi:peptidoglycan-binding domain-containing protein [Neorhizobium sp. NCHU2750]|uniref:peptidoglycan-binding domain-containing protein n=1 Tax=Neorhizobium sp. NCHU2750 TaxID=1825976 RepID=UPI000EB6C96A|nr:putative peptidoglycan binding protein [Neorhizobium sp. NCHU2750]
MVSGAGGAASGIGRTIIRNPKPSFYASVFIVAFSFVAANALWYQPQGGHLSPFLATRDPGDPNAIAGYRPFKPADPADVTTFRIERAPVGGKAAQNQQGQNQQGQQAQNQQAQNQQAQSQPAQNQPYTGLPAAVPANQTASTAAPTDDVRALIAGQSGAGQTASGSTPAVDPILVSSIQKALAGRGLYDGAADGLMGPRTQAAILFFEEASGLPQDGSPTPAVLAALQSQAGQSQQNQVQTANLQSYPQAPTPIPRQAPRPVVAASRPQAMQPVSQPMGQSSGQHAAQPVKVAARGMDPITAAIRSAEHQPMLPPASIPGSGGAAVVPVAKRSDTPLPSNMVLQIQKGLSNIAYTDVELDGVAGTQTKAAIRRFQKHYRLPETGEPDQMVLNKLKAIGAL